MLLILNVPAEEFEGAVESNEPEISRPGIIYFRHDRALRRNLLAQGDEVTG
jgi:hypothetical protein